MNTTAHPTWPASPALVAARDLAMAALTRGDLSASPPLLSEYQRLLELDFAALDAAYLNPERGEDDERRDSLRRSAGDDDIFEEIARLAHEHRGGPERDLVYACCEALGSVPGSWPMDRLEVSCLRSAGRGYYADIMEAALDHFEGEVAQE